MKKSILTIALLATTAAHAGGHKFIVGPPEFLLTVGTSFHNSEQDTYGTTNIVTLAVQSKRCYSADYVCYNPVFVHLQTSDNNTNDGLGMDFKFKVPKTMNNGYFLSVGPVVFGDPLNHDNGARLNYHLGAGMELKRFIFSVDMYGNPFDDKEGEPLQTVNVGYRF